MSQYENASYQDRKRRQWRLIVLVLCVAGLLIAAILVMSGGEDDPVTDQLLPPISIENVGTTDVEVVTPETSQAIDGAPLKPYGATGEHDDHHHDLDPPADEALDAGQAVATATEYAQLSINRPTDALGSADLNKKLVRLSTGMLARKLATNSNEMTAQVASEGEVIKSVPLVNKDGYAEVLIISKETVVDVTTGVPLDPMYLNYLVRLEQMPSGGFAVTSWEPQL